MTGTGTAGGAATIVNAFATGRGAAFGLLLRVEATVDRSNRFQVHDGRRRLPPGEARLVLETAQAVGRMFRVREPVSIRIKSEIPARKGLKSSSAVSVAVARAMLAHLGHALGSRQLLALVGDASVRSGTSLTGAYDDAAACLLGGVVFADNRQRRVMAVDQLPGDLVALLRIPRASVATARFRRVDFRVVAPFIEEAWNLGRAGRYKEAMLVNSIAYAPLLGTRPTWSLMALQLGAYAAGVSGKGPAEVALVHRESLEKIRPALEPVRLVELARREAS